MRPYLIYQYGTDEKMNNLNGGEKILKLSI